jgi:hypothetical protein
MQSPESQRSWPSVWGLAPIARPNDLDNSTGGGSRRIPGIRGSAGFNEKNMGLVLGDRSVLYALGHNEYFAWTQLNGAISQLNSNIPNEDQKEIVARRVYAKRIRP